MAAEPEDEDEGDQEAQPRQVDERLGPAERRCGISLGGDEPADTD